MKNTYIKVKPQTTGGETGSDEWVRPNDWLTLPELSEGQQKVVGLCAVWGDSDFIAVLCQGAYTVNWGDGTTENYASGVKAQHLFNYNALAGTDCAAGYRQSIVTITPQAGNNLTSINFNQKHTLQRDRVGWIDIAIVGSNISDISTTILDMLKQFSFIGTNSLTYCSSMFSGCYNIESIVSLNTSNCTSFSSMFQNCYKLKTIPLLNSSACTNFSSMFYGCYSLKTIPLLNTSIGTSFASMFYDCRSLQDVPLFNTSSGTNFQSMFQNCYSLETIPLIDTSKGTSHGNMFQNCFNLKTIPVINTSLSASTQAMFSTCSTLRKAPLLNVSNVTNYNVMFSGCANLQVGKLIGTKENISYANCNLSASQIFEIFVGLANVTGKTITLTGNWGVANLTQNQKDYATSKGWTLTL